MPKIASYLITDPSYYTHKLQTFKTRLEASFKEHRPNFALYRDKEFENYESFAIEFVRLCKLYNVKAMLHNHYALALRLEAYGVHYSSNQLCNIIQSPKLFQILSAHNEIEIQNAMDLGLNAVTISPIFHSPNKGEPLGLDRLQTLTETFDIDMIALGGILEEAQVEAVKAKGASGFASIRYFYPS